MYPTSPATMSQLIFLSLFRRRSLFSSSFLYASKDVLTFCNASFSLFSVVSDAFSCAVSMAEKVSACCNVFSDYASCFFSCSDSCFCFSKDFFALFKWKDNALISSPVTVQVPSQPQADEEGKEKQKNRSSSAQNKPYFFIVQSFHGEILSYQSSASSRLPSKRRFPISSRSVYCHTAAFWKSQWCPHWAHQ